MCCESDNEDLFRGVFDYVYGGYIIRCAVGIMTVVEAQNLHAQIINELEDSDYDSSVAQTCFENASKAGDTLELKLYMTDNSVRTVTDASQIASSDEIEKARVELKFTYAVAFFGIEQEHVLSGYAL